MPQVPQAAALPLPPRLYWKGGEPTAFVAALAKERNDLEAPAIELEPAIANVLAVLQALPDCRLARMSGSGATCFGLFPTNAAAAAAARTLRVGYPQWWVRATVLGSGQS